MVVKSFTTLIPYSGIHPDHHAWWIHPEDPNFMIEGNDGGIGISRMTAARTGCLMKNFL